MGTNFNGSQSVKVINPNRPGSVAGRGWTIEDHTALYPTDGFGVIEFPVSLIGILQ